MKTNDNNTLDKEKINVADYSEETLERFTYYTIDKSDKFKELKRYSGYKFFYISDDIDDYFLQLLDKVANNPIYEWALVEGSRIKTRQRQVIYAIVVETKEGIQSSKKLGSDQPEIAHRSTTYKRKGVWRTF